MMKKFLRTFLSVLLVLTLVVSAAACKKNPENPDNGDGDTGVVAELTVTAALGLDLFESKKIEAKDKNEVVVAATWSSSNTAVATVSADGTVSAKSTGTTTVTATYGENTATCTVTVRDSGERPNLSVFSLEKTIAVEGQVAFAPSITYKGAEIAATITATSLDESTVTCIVENGVVILTGVKAGSAIVEVGGTCGNYALTPVQVQVTVIAA